MTARRCCTPLHVVVNGVREPRHTCRARYWQPVRPVLEVLELRRGVVR